MKIFLRCKEAVIALLGMVLTLLGGSPVNATLQAGLIKPNIDSSSIKQTGEGPESDELVCAFEWQEPQPYARVITERDDLRIRAMPGGEVIGAVPKGWAVVVLGTDPTGRWTEITSHFGDGESIGFGSAPAFRNGWVATRYLEDLGEFCNKPMATMGVQLLASANAQQYLAHEDWLHIGDRIVRNSQHL